MQQTAPNTGQAGLSRIHWEPLWLQSTCSGLQVDLMHEVKQELAQKEKEARTQAEQEAAKSKPSKHSL